MKKEKELNGVGVAMDDKKLKSLVQNATNKSSHTADGDLCLAMYEKAQEIYEETGQPILEIIIETYRRERENHLFGDTLDYLNKEKGFWLNQLLGDGFTLGCHNALHADVRLNECYKKEVSYDDGRMFINASLIDVYAYFRRFFNCVGGRYSLKDKKLLSRHFFTNTEKSKDVLFNFFTYICMMRIIQFDIDDLLNGNESNLKDIEIFDPEAVLDYVDRLAEFMKLDPVLVRGIWVRIMSRYGEIMRDVNGRRVCGFKPTKVSEVFNKRFVAGVIGLLADMGVYKKEWTEMAAALEEDERAQGTVMKYMQRMCGDLNVMKEGMEVIREVVGRGDVSTIFR